MLLYLAGDYDDEDKLWSAFQNALSGLEHVNNDQLRIVAQVDGFGPGESSRGAERWTIEPSQDGESMTVDTTVLGEVPMDDQKTLIDFVKWGQDTFPAKHYYLAIADHGQGARGIAWDSTTDRDDDKQYNHSAYLTVEELGQALGSEDIWPVNVLHLDACSMNLLEVAYEVRDKADVLIASQYLGWNHFAYDRYAEFMTGETTPTELGEHIVDTYDKISQKKPYPYTISALDMDYLTVVQSALDGLAQELAPRIRSSEIDNSLIREIRTVTQSFDSQGDGQNDTDDLYVDLQHWAENLRERINISAIQEKASVLIEKLADFVSVSKASTGNFGDMEVMLDHAYGVSIFYPDSPYYATHQRYVNHEQFTFTARCFIHA